MRILNVRFKNLTSLRGEWNIDFTNPAYSTDGIFVITGPPGAGKTTILDAICLALYGRTPRPKDVMSRQAGECFAEVTFETDTGRYRAFWEQHREYKKPDGALQPPRHELTVAGGLPAAAQSGAANIISEAAGLSFDQFTRTVLLAQSDFAAFLRCGPEERSPFLERITGTEIYAQLPTRAHEIVNSERAALKLAEAETAGFRDMDADEKEALKAQLESLRQEEDGVVKKLERYNAEYDWLSNMTSIQKELDALDDRQKDLSRRQEGFESERARLLRAQKALEFGSAHAVLVTFRKEQESEKQSLLECHAKLPTLEANVRRSEEALQLAVSECLGKQADRKNLLDVLRKVRELDLKQKEKEPPIRENQAIAGELASAAEAKREQFEAEQLKFEATQVQIRDVRKFLQDNVMDEKLIEQFDGIKSRFDLFCSFLDKRRRMSEEHAAADKLKNEAQKRLSRQSLVYDTAKARFESAEKSIKKQSGVLSETLGSRSISEWREILSSLMERRVKLRQIEEAFRHRAKVSASLLELRGIQDELESSQSECVKKITARRERIQALEEELRHLDVQAELIRRIKELEEARERLTNGQPCPLCGSALHPYAAGDIPQDDEVWLLTHRVRDELKKENNALSELNAENARLAEEHLRTKSDEASFQSRIQDIENHLTEDLTALQLALPKDLAPLDGIGAERNRSEEHLQKTRLLIERAEKGEELLRSMRNEFELTRQDRDQSASSRQEAEFEKEAAARELERIVQDIRFHDEELKNIRLDLTRQVMPFGFKNLPEERPEQVLEALETRLAKWREHYKLRTELEKRISVWERDLHHERATLDSLNLELKDKNETVKKLRAEKDSLRQQRVNMFGEKDPDKEEAKQNALLEKAEKQVELKRESRTLVLQDLSDMRSRIEGLVKSIHIRAAALQKAEIAFKKQLIANDFSNEDAYLSACLPEEERKVLHERASALDMEQAELDALFMDRKFGLEEQRRRHVAEFTLEEAEEGKIQTAAMLKELRQSIENVSVRLEGGDDLSLKRAELEERAERQRTECRRWEYLHNLINSADGQKSAQEFTFEIILRNANQRLRKMTDRCFLVRDEKHPLSFSVTDNNGEFRSAKNLSEGENFTVSLALALALSQLIAPKVKADSIFLDDGFGSMNDMNEESLDMALSALAGLRREGRLIGIVSNAESLKKRISSQIEVIPQENGHSLIKAPGCTN
ncbi:MAG: AAA family ATPase [Synergistaceae bacterium]|nr:AAA family ATPase [Synergistaceae bacterium]